MTGDEVVGAHEVQNSDSQQQRRARPAWYDTALVLAARITLQSSGTSDTIHRHASTMHSVYLNALCQHVSRFGFLDGRMSDVRIRAFGRVYHLHRLFLVQASFFNGLFCAGFAESKDGISDIEPEMRGRRRAGTGAGAHDPTLDEEDSGILDLPFEDPNITRPAFEYCIAHLYGAAPELVLPEWASPQPSQPLSSAFVIPAAPGQGSLPQSAGLAGQGADPSASSSSNSAQHPATPRFLLSLLATSIYLGLPSVTNNVITLILYSITPFTIMHYLRFATGQTVLGASEAMQRSVMHEDAFSAPTPSEGDGGRASARPDVWDWELEGPIRGLEHLGKVSRRPLQRKGKSHTAQASAAQGSSARRNLQASDSSRDVSSGPSSLLQQTKNLSLHDGDTSTGPNSNDGHHTTAPASPQLTISSKVDGAAAPDTVTYSGQRSATGASEKVKIEPVDGDSKRPGELTSPRTPLQRSSAGSPADRGPAPDGRDSRSSHISVGFTVATDYQTDDAEFLGNADSRSYPVRPPLLGEEDLEMARAFKQPFHRNANTSSVKTESPPLSGKTAASRFGHTASSRTSGGAPTESGSAAATPTLGMSNRSSKRSQFYYGSWGEKMGEACACWLVRFGADILEEEVSADEQRAAETEGWMIMRAQAQSVKQGQVDSAVGLGAGTGAAPWQLALQIPSGEVSNSIYGAAGLPASPSPFGRKSPQAYHSTPRAPSAHRDQDRLASGDDYDSDGNLSFTRYRRASQFGDFGTGADMDAALDAPDEDRFIRTYMLPYGQLPEQEQLAQPPPLLVWSLGHMSSDWVREIISSDSFFVRTEWERFAFAAKVVELRRRQKLRRLAVLKICGYVAGSTEDEDSSDENGTSKGRQNSSTGPNAGVSSPGEQWRRLTSQNVALSHDYDESDEDDGDDEDDDDDLVQFQQGRQGRYARRPSNTGKGKTPGARTLRRDRSPGERGGERSRRTSFASNANASSDPRSSVKGTPETPYGKRSSGKQAYLSPRGSNRGTPKRSAWQARNGSGLPHDSDELEYEDLFKKGIYYTHMSFDELNRISSKVSSMTGTTFVTLSVLQSALWAGSELKNHILSGGLLSQGPSGAANATLVDPPPQLPNMWPEHGPDDTHAGGQVGGAEQGGTQNGSGMNNSATLPPIKDLHISSTLSEFRLAAEAMLKGNSNFNGAGTLFDPNLSYFMTGQDHSRPPITLGGHMASPLMLGAASKPGALLGKRYFPVLSDSTVRLGGSTTPIFGSGGAGTQGSGADKNAMPDTSMQVPPSPATQASGAMGVAAAKDPLALTLSSSLQGGVAQSGQPAAGTLAASLAAAADNGAHSSGNRANRAAKYFGISNVVRTGRELAADATILEDAQARSAQELSEEESMMSASEAGDNGDEKTAEGGQGAEEKPPLTRKQKQEELIRNELETSRWTGYEPMRIGAEFYGVDTLQDKQRMYSPTFFYAGSLWNLYVQTTKKSKGLQLGVYLHRQAPHDPLPVVSLPPVAVPRLTRRADDSLIERSTTPIHRPLRAHNLSPAQSRAGTSSAARMNQVGAGNSSLSLFLNIPGGSGGQNSNTPVAGPSSAPSANHTSSIIISTSPGAGSSTVPMSMPSNSSTSLVMGGPLSSSPGASRMMTGPFLSSTGSAPGASSIVANSQAPIPGSNLGTGGSLFQAVNARYQEVAAADPSGGGPGNAAAQTQHVGDAGQANAMGGADASQQQQQSGGGSLPRDTSTASTGPSSAGAGMTTAPAPQVPYTDPRRELRAFFSIHCPSPLGSSLTRFSSGPDRFALTQSWGWKSSSLLMTMYLPERKLTEAKTEAHRSFRCVCTLSLGP